MSNLQPCWVVTSSDDRATLASQCHRIFDVRARLMLCLPCPQVRDIPSVVVIQPVRAARPSTRMHELPCRSVRPNRPPHAPRIGTGVLGGRQLQAARGYKSANLRARESKRSSSSCQLTRAPWCLALCRPGPGAAERSPPSVTQKPAQDTMIIILYPSTVWGSPNHTLHSVWAVTVDG